MAVCHRGFCKALTQPLLMAMLQLLLFLLLQLQLGHSRKEASDIGDAAIFPPLSTDSCARALYRALLWRSVAWWQSR